MTRTPFHVAASREAKAAREALNHAGEWGELGDINDARRALQDAESRLRRATRLEEDWNRLAANRGMHSLRSDS